jgi:hypothetical protein
MHQHNISFGICVGVDFRDFVAFNLVGIDSRALDTSSISFYFTCKRLRKGACGLHTMLARCSPGLWLAASAKRLRNRVLRAIFI